MSRKRLSPGHLRHLIVIQTMTSTGDGRGGGTEAWSTHATAFARVSPLSAREAYIAGQVQGSITHRVTLRYIEGVSPAMRVVWNERVFVIQGARNVDEADRLLELDVVEERA